MQLAIAIQSEEDMGLLESPWGSPHLTGIEQETCFALREAISRHLGQDDPTRVYFGSEFCQYRMVDQETLIRAYNQAVCAGYEFTFVAPYAPQEGWKRLKQLLTSLAEHRRQRGEYGPVEVVVNDWGVLHFVKNHPEAYSPVLGRLLNKMIRDPRVTQHYNRETVPKQAHSVFKQASFTVDYYQQFMRDAGVKIIEMDNAFQGMEWDDSPDNFGLSIHVGFGCVATGRTCLVGSLHVETSEKFRGHIICKQQCRHYTAEMINRNPRIDTLQQRVWQKGNSVFYQQTFGQIEQGIELAKKSRAHRLIYSPRIPV